MQTLRQAASGIFMALVSMVMVLGGFSVAFAEENLPVPAPILLPTNSVPEIFPSPVGPTPPIPTLPMGLPTASPVNPPTETIVPPSSCPPPQGWTPYKIYPGDSLESLAQQFHTTTDILGQANCLYSPSLLPGYTLYVPPAPAPSLTPTRCAPPAGWVRYTVQPGDNLYRIGLSYGLKAVDLQRANCLPSADRIIAGSIIYVPNIPTLTPMYTNTPAHTPTIPPTVTPAVTLTPAPPTNTPLTIILLPTNTEPPPTSTPTSTSQPSPAPTQ